MTSRLSCACAMLAAARMSVTLSVGLVGVSNQTRRVFPGMRADLARSGMLVKDVEVMPSWDNFLLYVNSCSGVQVIDFRDMFP